MAIVSASGFTGAIKSLRTLDEKARGLVSNIIAYALYQYHNGNNKTPYLTITNGHKDAKDNGNLPGWLASSLAQNVKLGTRNKGAHTEEVCTRMGDTLAAVIFATEAERKAQRKAARVEKAAKAAAAPQQQASEAPDVQVRESDGTDTVIEGECATVELEYALVIGGEVKDITAAEADALYDTLMAIRQQVAALKRDERTDGFGIRLAA